MPTNNSINSQDPIQVSKGGLGVNSTTAYGVLAGGTTSTAAIQNIGAGTSGQILKSNGSSSLPTFVAPSSVGGSMVLLGTIEFNNTASTYNITSSFSADYKTYKLLFTAMETPSGVEPDIRLRVSTDGGSTFITTGYKSFNAFFYGPGSGSGTQTTYIQIGAVNGVAGQLSDSETLITGYGTNKGITTRSTYMTGQTDVVYNIAAGYYPSATINGIQIFNGNGNNYISGQLSIYGIVQ